MQSNTSFLIRPEDAQVELAVAINDKSVLRLASDLMHEAEFGLFRWVIGGLTTAGLNTFFSGACDEAWAKAITPGLASWSKTAQRAWLSELRWRAFYSFDSLRLRLAAINLALREVESHADALRGMQAFGFGRSEALLYIETLRDDEARITFFNTLGQLADPAVKADLTLDARVITAQMDEDFRLRKMQRAAQCKVRYGARDSSARLVFVAQHNNLSLDDLANDLIERAIGYYLMNRPFKTRLHAQNIAKAAMDGRLQQLITYYKHPDRARLVEDGVGSRVVVLSLQDFDVSDESSLLAAGDDEDEETDGYYQETAAV